MHFSRKFIEFVRNSLCIREVISNEGVNLEKSGRRFLGLCPFHKEKTPSFSVVIEGQFYLCFGCGKGGDVFTFVMEKKKLNFPEAVEYLATIYKIK